MLAYSVVGGNGSPSGKRFGFWDSLKFKAAVFLITYMPGKYAKVFPKYNIYKPVFDTLESLNVNYEKTYKKNNAEFYKYYKQTVFDHFLAEHPVEKTATLYFEIKQDLNTITADYLIENIDYAFKAWEMPWNKNLSFADFCEYILPYRYGHEELQPWRKAFFEKNKNLRDSLKNETDPVKAAMFLKLTAYVCELEIAELRGLGNAIKPLDLIRINTTTSCDDESGLMLLRLRALGVPVARLTIPFWGDFNPGHDLNGVLTADKKWMAFGSGIETGPYKPPYKTTKVFAEMYSSNPNSTTVEIYPPYKIQSNYIDVTNYVVKTTDLSIPMPGVNNGTKGYLSVFSSSHWIPIVQSAVHNGAISFPGIGKDIIYVVATIDSNKLEVQGNPFLLDNNGIMHPIIPSTNQKTITVTRKYPPNELQGMLQTLNGCYFQGSNDSSFTHAVTLWKVDNLTSLRTVEQPIKNADYQYVRLVFPSIDRKNEELGGIQFYSENNTGKTLLRGAVISSTKASTTFYQHVFDNDPLTFVKLLNSKSADFKQYFDGDNLVIPDKQIFWVGVKFKSKMHITSIGFSPRTDDNDVIAGERYRLFYWDKNKWALAGQKIAETNNIEFTVPENDIYWLRNATKGKEHRIFLYQNNKQVWY